MPHATRRSFQNLGIILFIALNVFCITRSYILEDARFGWGMFMSSTNYMVHYSLVLRDGTRVPYNNWSDFRSRVVRVHLSPGVFHTQGYGTYAFKEWVHQYLMYTYKERIIEHPEMASVEAEVQYQTNLGKMQLPLRITYP